MVKHIGTNSLSSCSERYVIVASSLKCVHWKTYPPTSCRRTRSSTPTPIKSAFDVLSSSKNHSSTNRGLASSSRSTTKGYSQEVCVSDRHKPAEESRTDHIYRATGSNWIPADQILPMIEEGRYRKLLELAVSLRPACEPIPKTMSRVISRRDTGTRQPEYDQMLGWWSI